jgi:hypothetical protein
MAAGVYVAVLACLPYTKLFVVFDIIFAHAPWSDLARPLLTDWMRWTTFLVPLSSLALLVALRCSSVTQLKGVVAANDAAILDSTKNLERRILLPASMGLVLQSTLVFSSCYWSQSGLLFGGMGSIIQSQRAVAAAIPLLVTAGFIFIVSSTTGSRSSHH